MNSLPPDLAALIDATRLNRHVDGCRGAWDRDSSCSDACLHAPRLTAVGRVDTHNTALDALAAKVATLHAESTTRRDLLRAVARACRGLEPPTGEALSVLGSVLNEREERGAVLARAVEALREHHRFRIDGRDGSFLMICAECGTSKAHRDTCGIGALLSDPTATACLDEHRAMTAELEAWRVLDEGHAAGDEEGNETCPRYECECDVCPCTCGLAARQDAARKVVDAAREKGTR